MFDLCVEFKELKPEAVFTSITSSILLELTIVLRFDNNKPSTETTSLVAIIKLI